MNQHSLKEAILLAVSGELSPAARRRLLAELENHPHLHDEVEKTEEAFRVLQHVPIHEPSAQERREIPAALKQAIRTELATHENRARRGKTLTRYALATAAGLVVVVTAWIGVSSARHSYATEQQAQAARIDALIDRVAPAPFLTTAGTADTPGSSNPTLAVHAPDTFNIESFLLSAPPPAIQPPIQEDPSAPPGF